MMGVSVPSTAHLTSAHLDRCIALINGESEGEEERLAPEVIFEEGDFLHTPDGPHLGSYVRAFPHDEPEQESAVKKSDYTEFGSW